MEADEIDIIAFAVLGRFDQVEDAKETGSAGEFWRNVGESDGLDGVDLDFAFFHAITRAGADTRACPDAHTYGDLARSHSCA